MRLLQAWVVLPLVSLGLVGCVRREPVYYSPEPVDYEPTAASVAVDAAAATIDVVAEQNAIARYNRRIEAERQERAEEEGRRAYIEAAEEAAVKHPKRCNEVKGLKLPEPPPGRMPLRAMDCDGRLFVEDEQGHWRDYAPPQAQAEPTL